MALFVPLARAADEPRKEQKEPLPINVFRNLEAGKKQTVAVYGTSLTAAAEWPKALKAYFEKQFPGRVTFVNAAQSGQQSDWGVANLQKRVLSRDPDLVFIEFSVNDAATKHDISTDKSAANLDGMVKALRQQNPQADIVLQTMNPAWDSPDEPSRKKYASDRPHLEEYYDVYRRYAREHGLPLVDSYPNWRKLQREDDEKFKKWLPEGLHPIPEASLAVTWPAIQDLLERARAAAARTTAAPPTTAGEPVELQVTPVAPTRVERRGGGVYFADFGKDAYGDLRITFADDPPAAALTVRLGEKLDAEGAIDRDPPGSVNYREVPLPVAPGKRVYRLDIPPKNPKRPPPVTTPPEIGYVTPFRYAEVEGAPLPPPEKIELRQLFVHAPFDDDASSFESSDPTLNAVWDLCKHTMKATTAFGVYIDGDRERKPYEADAFINLLSHYACDLDPRVARRTFEYLLEHPTWPTEWGLTMPMIAAADYRASGDPVLAARHYDALKGKLLADRAGPDGLLRAPGIVDWPSRERDGYDDGKRDPEEPKEVGPEVNTVVNAYYYHALRCMELLAGALDKGEDARAFAARAGRVRDAFNARFFDAARGVYVDGEGSGHASLHANLFAAAFGLVPAERREGVLGFVQSRGMACSVYGAQYLLEALFEGGRDDYAVRLMTSRGERGWWHMIELGSTMTMEAWDLKVKRNATWNHAWGAAPANILSRFVLGVRPLEPGYGKVLVAPQPGGLAWVRGKVPTPHGAVKVSLQNAARCLLEIDVPPGVTARVELPRGKRAQVSLDGKTAAAAAAAAATAGGGTFVADGVGPGHHIIEAQ